MMQNFTDFADQGVILPVVLLAGFALAAAGWWRGALAWACVVPGTLLVVMAGKMFTSACGQHVIGGWDLHSPSGHTASAALVYGALAALLIPTERRGVVAVLCATVSAALIGFSRLALAVHTFADVVAGAAIGIAGAYILVRLTGPRPARLRHARAIFAAICVVTLLFHGSHVYAEALIAHYAPRFWPFDLCRY